MKKLFLTLALVMTASTAMADYFYCELKNGFVKAEAEADYGVRQASVTMRPFSCEGRVVPGTRLVEVKITSTETGEYRVAQEPYGLVSVKMYGLDIHGDGQDLGECTCGVR